MNNSITIFHKSFKYLLTISIQGFPLKDFLVNKYTIFLKQTNKKNVFFFSFIKYKQKMINMRKLVKMNFVNKRPK